MSTLVLAMALCSAPGNAPAGASTEVEEPLRMPDGWSGSFEREGDKWLFEVFQPAVRLWVVGKNSVTQERRWLLDEGRGRFRLQRYGGSTWLGLYRWEGSRLVLCLGMVENRRPTSFCTTRQQQVFTLRRAR